MHANQLLRFGKTGNHISFYLVFGILGVLASLIGFFKTYFLPMSVGEFEAPVWIHMHGAISASWVLLYLVQVTLVYKRSRRSHQTLGFLGLFILFVFVFTMIPLGQFIVERELQKGNSDTAYGQLWGVFLAPLWVLILFLAGFACRKSPVLHRSLMFLATVVVLWPAWARWRHYFPGIPFADTWFQLIMPYLFIPMAWMWEKNHYRKIHPAFIVLGILTFAEALLESYLYESQWGKEMAKWLYLQFYW